MINLFHFLKGFLEKGFLFLGEIFPKLYNREVLWEKESLATYSIILNIIIEFLSFGLTFFIFYLFFLLGKKGFTFFSHKLFLKLFYNYEENKSPLEKFFNKSTDFFSYLLIYSLYSLFFPLEKEGFFFYFHKALSIFLILKGASFFSYLVINLHYSKALKMINETVPLKGLLKLLSFIIWAVSFISIILVLFDITLAVFLATLGTLSAVTLLIFQKNILNTYSIFIFYYEEMVKEGDWIEASSLKCNGIVTNVGFNIIKVKNFDTSVSSFSPSDLMASSFRNWSYLDKNEEGLRTKQVIWIEEKSVKNLTIEDIQKIQENPFFKEFLEKKKVNLTLDLRNIDLLKSFLLFYFESTKKGEDQLFLSLDITSKTERGVPLEILYISHNMKFSSLEKFKSSFIKTSLKALSCVSLITFQREESFFTLED